MALDKFNKERLATPMTEQPPAERVKNFKEVACGYTLNEAVLEAQRCMDCTNRPCVDGCPVGVDIPGFVRQIAEGKLDKAHSTLKKDNSLPAICGRVCPQETQCQGLCTRGRAGDPVAIGRLERFIADWGLENADKAGNEQQGTGLENRRVALIGSGPASLTCASELARRGVQTSVFEALHKAGGVLVYGIPEFRLPNELVETEISHLEEAGVKIELDSVIGKLHTIDELMDEMGFDAVFVGTGAGLPRYLGIEGEALNGVCVANELLTRVNLMHAYEFPAYATPVHVGKRCVVVGGGNVAMDAARTAARLGAKTTIVYRRSEAEMPARDEEIAHAKEEGVEFATLLNPICATGDENGWIQSLTCQKMQLGEPDESGRRKTLPIEGQSEELPCDMLVVAVGSKTNPLIAQTTEGLDSNGRGLISVDEETGATSRPGVFAGGDVTTGAATVILAMGAGKRAARGIISYLENLPQGK